MRFSLIDLLIAIACITLGSFAVGGVGYLTGYQLFQAGTELFVVPVGAIVGVLFPGFHTTHLPAVRSSAAVSPSVPTLQEAASRLSRWRV